jgi:hypothetical protein
MRSLCWFLVFAAAILITAGCGNTETEEPTADALTAELKEGACALPSILQADEQGWSAPQEVAEKRGSFELAEPASIAIDQDGHWHIVFRDEVWIDVGVTTTYIKYLNETSGPYVIAEETSAPMGAGGVGGPSIAIDSNGGLHVAYNYMQPGSGPTPESVMYTYNKPPKLFVVIPGVGFGNTPEHGAMMLWRAVNMFRDDYECIKEIREVDNAPDSQVRDMITEAIRKAKEKGKDVIVNIDMDLDNFSVLEYINPFSKRWQQSVKWAGRMANVVSDAFKEINPTGIRILYAHSAGVDATTRSVQQRPGKRMYDDLNLFNGRTKAPALADSLISSGYSWWQVKVFTSKGDFPAFPNSLSNYDAAKRLAGPGRAWVHLHSLTITGHNGLRDSIGVEGTFEVNLGSLGSRLKVGTVEEMMLKDWREE